MGRSLARYIFGNSCLHTRYVRSSDRAAAAHYLAIDSDGNSTFLYQRLFLRHQKDCGPCPDTVVGTSRESRLRLPDLLPVCPTDALQDIDNNAVCRQRNGKAQKIFRNLAIRAKLISAGR